MTSAAAAAVDLSFESIVTSASIMFEHVINPASIPECEAVIKADTGLAVACFQGCGCSFGSQQSDKRDKTRLSPGLTACQSLAE